MCYLQEDHTTPMSILANHPDEKELLIQIAADNQFAFRKLFTLYYQPLGTYIYRITESTELAEEIVQDVFLKIWENRTTLTKVQDFKAYLFIVSKNHTLNCIRKLAKERMLKNEWENTFLQDQGQNDLSNYYKLIDQAIDQLPPQQQKVYILSRHKRLKYAEISNEMNISSETVKKYLQLANGSITNYVRENLESVLLLLLFLNFF